MELTYFHSLYVSDECHNKFILNTFGPILEWRDSVHSGEDSQLGCSRVVWVLPSHHFQVESRCSLLRERSPEGHPSSNQHVYKINMGSSVEIEFELMRSAYDDSYPSIYSDWCLVSMVCWRSPTRTPEWVPKVALSPAREWKLKEVGIVRRGVFEGEKVGSGSAFTQPTTIIDSMMHDA